MKPLISVISDLLCFGFRWHLAVVHYSMEIQFFGIIGLLIFFLFGSNELPLSVEAAGKSCCCEQWQRPIESECNAPMKRAAGPRSATSPSLVSRFPKRGRKDAGSERSANLKRGQGNDRLSLSGELSSRRLTSGRWPGFFNFFIYTLGKFVQQFSNRKASA